MTNSEKNVAYSASANKNYLPHGTQASQYVPSTSPAAPQRTKRGAGDVGDGEGRGRLLVTFERG
jgi:hypothetical protein